MELGAFSVSLSVKDIAASRSFYERFGFEVFDGDVAQNWLILKNGAHVIGLFQGMFDKNTLTFNPGWDSNDPARIVHRCPRTAASAKGTRRAIADRGRRNDHRPGKFRRDRSRWKPDPGRSARLAGMASYRPAPRIVRLERIAMKLRKLVSTLGLAFAASGAFAASPYAGQESREIKALAPEDVSALLSGQGMGFAKVAELNGFAGPAHVLELATQLHLTPEQRARTEALFASMSAKARSAGLALVEKERDLDQQFASKAITAEHLGSALEEIGVLQARVREAHLEAHLAQAAILTPEQNARYAELRGYGAANLHRGHEHQR
jgi:Spy/CpxP family protein refolding chaperone